MIPVDIALWASLICYLFGWAAQFSYLQKKLNLSPNVGLRSLQIGCLIHSSYLVYVFFHSDWPQTLILDFLKLIAWFPTLMYLFFQKQIRDEISSTGIPLFTIFVLGISAVLSSQNIPTIETIRDAPIVYQTTLIIHISTMIAGYILFGLSCFSSILFLYQEHQIKTKLVKLLVNQFPSLSTLDQISYRSVILGFLFLTVGLILGVVLSDGLQSLRSIVRIGITLLIWLLYAFFLVERYFKGSARRYSAIWSVAGFFLVLMSLFVEFSHLV